jgi:oxalate decarboxylase/phosphoglucose isomerase-like protein (cupin superfamily)
MNLFDGKVKIRPLLKRDQPATRSEVQARLLSPGGELAVLADGITAIRHLAYVELREGKPRGNHYHKLRHESFYLICGELEVLLQDLASGERVTAVMQAGDLAEIPPNIVHTFVPRTSGHALEFAPEVFDGSDVYRTQDK